MTAAIAAPIARTRNYLADFLATFFAAIDAAAAVREHRRPADADLRALGIDPETFPTRL